MIHDETLRIAGHLLEHHGTSGAFAVNMSGHAVDLYAREANRWCLVGAIRVVNVRVRHRHPDCAYQAIDRACRLLGELTSTDLGELWDAAHPDKRQRIIARLKRAGLDGAP